VPLGRSLPLTIAKVEWSERELFPRIEFIVANSELPSGKGVKVSNGLGDVEYTIKGGNSTLRQDKTSNHEFVANQTPWLMGVTPQPPHADTERRDHGFVYRWRRACHHTFPHFLNSKKLTFADGGKIAGSEKKRLLIRT